MGVEEAMMNQQKEDFSQCPTGSTPTHPPTPPEPTISTNDGPSMMTSNCRKSADRLMEYHNSGYQNDEDPSECSISLAALQDCPEPSNFMDNIPLKNTADFIKKSNEQLAYCNQTKNDSVIQLNEATVRNVLSKWTAVRHNLPTLKNELDNDTPQITRRFHIHPTHGLQNNSGRRNIIPRLSFRGIHS